MKRTKIMQQISCLLLILLLTLGIASTPSRRTAVKLPCGLVRQISAGTSPLVLQICFREILYQKILLLRYLTKGQSPFIIMQISAPALKSWRKY